MEFLIGNPFATPVGQRIEHATSSSLQSEDWGLNMEICDIVNGTEEGPKDAVKAIKKRIVGNKIFREIMLALTVLEACVKNCGHRFHVLVSTREFVEAVLVRAILRKNNPPLVLHDRVLSLIQAWADAFRSSPALTGVVSVYEDLRRKGLEFPMTELDAYSPIHTPNKSVPESVSPVTMCAAPSSPKPASQPALQPAPPHSPGGSPTVSPDQVKKLRGDMEVIQSNLKVMSDMMSQLDPVSAQPSDIELLQQLHTMCKDMQDRLVELIPRLSEEKLIEELLVANDDINATFTRYHRFEKVFYGKNTTQQCPSYANLIDLSPASKTLNQSEVAAAPTHRSVSQSVVSSLSNQMAILSPKEVDELTQKQSNSLAQQRKSERLENSVTVDGMAKAHTQLQNVGADSNPDSTPISSSPQFDWMVEKGMIPVHQGAVMDDIEKWLDVDEDEDLADSEGVTSEEFDKFLAERAKVVDHLPSIPVHQGAVMDDIEKWLDVDEDEDLADSEGVTSEEFDKFLAERAKVADHLPSVRASPHDPSHSQP